MLAAPGFATEILLQELKPHALDQDIHPLIKGIGLEIIMAAGLVQGLRDLFGEFIPILRKQVFAFFGFKKILQGQMKKTADLTRIELLINFFRGLQVPNISEPKPQGALEVKTQGRGAYGFVA